MDEDQARRMHVNPYVTHTKVHVKKNRMGEVGELPMTFTSNLMRWN